MAKMKPDDVGNVKPIPDPTALTTDALHREAAALRREMERDARIAEVRINAVEQAMKLRMWVGYVGAVGLLSLVLLIVNALR